MNEKLKKLADYGQSLWLDDLRRAYLDSGDLERWVEIGLRGETSNPSIFDEAISESEEYDDDLRKLAEEGLDAEEIVRELMEADIRDAADVLRPVYDETDGADGYISVEVSPHLAYDTEATLEEARRLFAATDRPNVMVKVPATDAGIPAIRELIGEGRNINITLMFSLDHYDAVSEAFISGLERWVERGGDISRVASVASFFVSRIDVKVDARLDEISENHPLRGTIGIANAKMAYQLYKERFESPRWLHLSAAGGCPQRPLWASTSVKDLAYPDTMYVDGLIGRNTVNTVPPKTFKAFLDHGTVQPTLDSGLDEARGQLEMLARAGIDLDEITGMLIDEGVRKFADSYDALLETVEAKRKRIAQGI